jgi:hypothetical protein
MDETNLDFDVTLRKMLERIGPWTVSGYKVDHAARATVVLAVSMSGVKLPAPHPGVVVGCQLFAFFKFVIN